ncbi:Telomeric repeat-binding factor 2 [Zancudomyces culisetae]|nr:Telomeric repeat-binding factor 2 [Zancudomyces culisetae]|eukprot:OMH84997.1 Telomeric repeat-binding factor 2 [Zancudomyces culisetae]
MHSQIETESETDDEIESDDKAETDDEIENNDNKIENNPSQQKKVLCNKLMRYGVRSLSEFSPLLGLKITKELVKPEHVYEIRESAHTRKVSQLTNVYSSSRNRSVSSSGIEFEAPLNYKSDNGDKRGEDDIVSVEELLKERPDNLINRANKGINYKNNTLTNLGIRSKSINKSLKSDIGRSSTKKRKWTQSEDDALRHGYRQFGRNWAKIKQKYGAELVNRTNVNIKDRFRILSKTETF